MAAAIPGVTRPQLRRHGCGEVAEGTHSRADGRPDEKHGAAEEAHELVLGRWLAGDDHGGLPELWDRSMAWAVIAGR
jgi:hypothetical protein